MVTNVLLYASLELLSLVGIAVLTRRMLSISLIYQLGFVLETQWSMVQSKLLVWIFYAVQNLLNHIPCATRVSGLISMLHESVID